MESIVYLLNYHRILHPRGLLTFPSPCSGTSVREIFTLQAEKYTKWLVTGVLLTASAMSVLKPIRDDVNGDWKKL